MNLKVIRTIVGRMLFIEAALMLPAVLVSICYQEAWYYWASFLVVQFVLVGLGILAEKNKPQQIEIYAKDGLAIVALSWIIFSFFGAFPFFMTGEIPKFIDCFFEATSGFTTTGSSILSNVEVMAKSLQFWRSFTHLAGGMGVLVFALAVLPGNTNASIHLIKAEVPGPVFGKILSKIKDTARILYIIYIVMTVVVIILLLCGGMPFFDSLIHAFGAAGTGGFSIYRDSIAHYDSNYLHLVITFAMLIFGINFNLFYLIIIGQIRKAVKSEELKYYLLTIVVAVGLIAINIKSVLPNFMLGIRDAFFQVVSIITTTGYATVDYNKWPLFSKMILLMLMFIGGCAGSTAGGIKVSRVAILVKTAFKQFKRSRNPNLALCTRFEGKVLDQDVTRGVTRYFLVYVVLFWACVLLISLDSDTFATAFSAVAATYNNIGPGFDIVGPSGNFSHFSLGSKLVLSFAMIAGRLEIYPLLVLFSFKAWKRSR